MTPFEQAYAEVADLVRDFEAHESEYLSPKYQESEVRTDFLDKFWAAFGWDVRHKYQTNPREQEVKVEKNPDGHTSSRKADYAFHLMPDYRSVVFFCEAKKPSVALGNAESYFQLVRYGRGASTPVGVLTDFEEFHIVDCRYEANLQKSFPSAQIRKFHYKEYLDRDAFGYIYWLFSREAIEQGKLKEFTKTLPKQRGKGAAKLTAEEAKPTDEKFLDTLEDYRLRLAKAFKKADESLTAEQLTEATMKVIDRLVFVRFLEDKNIEADYIIDQIAAKKGGAWKSFVNWSKELDVKYNGVVFKPHDIDQPSFAPPDDKVFADICTELSHSHSKYIFSYIPVELLGSIYERFLGKVVTATAKRADIEYKPEVRKAGGVYYTPKYIVDYIVANTVGKILTNAEAPPQRGGVGVVSSGEGLAPKDVAKLRFADIACGSGSFLIAVYDAVLHHVESYYNAHPEEAKKAGCLEIDNGVWALSLKQKQRILLDNIYGVDIDPQAVEVAQLSLFLKLLEGESGATAGQMSFEKTKILPDLSKNIVCGNSLVDYDIETLFKLTPEEELRIKPFSFEMTFKEVMSKGGFDAIVGNPPYVRQELLGPLKHYFESKFSVYQGTADLYAYFIERGVSLLRPGGKFSYIVANKWMRAGYGAPLRIWLKGNHIEELVDFGDLQVFKGATTYPCIITIAKAAPRDYIRAVLLDTLEFESLVDMVEAKRFDVDIRSLQPEGWTLANSSEIALLSKLRTNSVPLGTYVDGKIYRGVLTGLNEAFVIDYETRARLIEADPRSAEIIKPFLAGRDVQRYGSATIERYLIFTRRGIDISQYPAIEQHLLPFKPRLMPRPKNYRGETWQGRKPGNYEWYEIQDSIEYFADFELPKILYLVFQVRPAFTFDYSGVFGNNAIWFIPSEDKFLLALLNSRLGWYLISNYCTQIQGGYQLIYKYMEQLPIRSETTNNGAEKSLQTQIAALADQMLDAKKRLASARSDSERTQLERKCDYLDAEIDKLVYQLYGLTEEEISIVEGRT